MNNYNLMKLELKHIVPYFPYKLKCQVKEKKQIVIAELDGIYSDGSCTFCNLVESEKGFEFIKPILRPLSDLTKDLYYELSGKTEKNSFGFWYWKYNGDDDKREYIYHSGYTGLQYFLCDGYGQFSYKMMTFFFQNHFDVFGLLEAGLAVDMNTLNTKNEQPLTPEEK